MAENKAGRCWRAPENQNHAGEKQDGGWNHVAAPDYATELLITVPIVRIKLMVESIPNDNGQNAEHAVSLEWKKKQGTPLSAGCRNNSHGANVA